VDDFPEVVVLDLDDGGTVQRYSPQGAVQGITADGNRVFVLSEGSLTALPVF
jgi:hypothetical protein